jgi:hypothetical protein
MLWNSEGKVIQEEKEVAEHCRLCFERLLNERFIENGVTESPREGGGLRGTMTQQFHRRELRFVER